MNSMMIAPSVAPDQPCALIKPVPADGLADEGHEESTDDTQRFSSANTRASTTGPELIPRLPTRPRPFECGVRRNQHT